MRKSESIQKLMTAIGALQAEAVKITKDSQNPHFKSKYASLPQILDVIQPVLAKHKLAYTQIPEGGKIICLLMHTDSGEWIESEYDLNNIQQTPQAVGSAITYARRYSLTSTLGLNIDDDDDGNAASEPGKNKQQQPQNQQGNPPAQQQTSAAPQQQPHDPFKQTYTDGGAILAVLNTATAKEHVLTLYTANKALIDGNAGLQAEMKKKKLQLENGGKQIITDKQFEQVCERVRKGDLNATQNALNVFVLNDKQREYLVGLNNHVAKVDEAVKAKLDNTETMLTLIEACTNEPQMNTLYKNNSMMIDRDQTVGKAYQQKYISLKPAA